VVIDVTYHARHTLTDSFFNLQRVFLEGNPYLLGLTMVVSLLHSLFDFLAFKNGMYSMIYDVKYST
jgi:hypothetical protein